MLKPAPSEVRLVRNPTFEHSSGLPQSARLIPKFRYKTFFARDLGLHLPLSCRVLRYLAVLALDFHHKILRTSATFTNLFQDKAYYRFARDPFEIKNLPGQNVFGAVIMTWCRAYTPCSKQSCTNWIWQDKMYPGARCRKCSNMWSYYIDQHRKRQGLWKAKQPNHLEDTSRTGPSSGFGQSQAFEDFQSSTGSYRTSPRRHGPLLQKTFRASYRPLA